MPLADTTTQLTDRSSQLRSTLENAAEGLHDALDNHLTHVDSLIRDVAAVAAIAGHPLMQAAENALHVPAPVLDGIAGMLNAVAAQYPKPEPEPAAPVQAGAGEQPQAGEEPQPEQPAA